MDREDDRQERDGHEEERFDRLVCGSVIGRGELAVKCVDKWLIDPEIDDREDEREGKRQSLPEPFTQERELELPSDYRDPLHRENHDEIRAAERVLSGVGPYVI